MSSATSMTSGLARPGSAISGGYSQAEAQDVAALADVSGFPARALDGEVEARPFTRQRYPEAGGERVFRHLLAVQSERQRARTRAEPERDDALHQSRTARLEARSRVPAVEGLDAG